MQRCQTGKLAVKTRKMNCVEAKQNFDNLQTRKWNEKQASFLERERERERKITCSKAQPFTGTFEMHLLVSSSIENQAF